MPDDRKTRVGRAPTRAPAKPAIQYRGTTERGRQAVGASLQDVVTDVEYLAGVAEGTSITVQEVAGCWCVYANQEAVDADAVQVAARSVRTAWYAVVRTEAVRS